MKAGGYVSREYEIAERLSGRPNIVPYIGLYYTQDENDRLVQNMLFEYCEQGTLHDFLE
jgi:serine/threonine protein kinase